MTTKTKKEQLDLFRRLEWDEAKDEGYVRVRIVLDDNFDLRDYNPEDSELARRKGVWGCVAEFWDGLNWQHADSCWGYIGEVPQYALDEHKIAAVEGIERWNDASVRADKLLADMRYSLILSIFDEKTK
jgi:hypothetical protein